MFTRLGRLAHTRRRLVIAAAALLAAVAAIVGPGVAQEVSDGGFTDPEAESTKAAVALEAAFGREPGDVVALWRHPTLSPGDPAYEAQLTAILAGLPAADVTAVVSPWTPGLPDEARAALIGADGRTAMAAIALAGDDDDERAAAYERIRDDLLAPEPWETHLAGQRPAYTELQERAEQDIARAETFALPVLLVLLVLIFGSLTAATLPVAIGGIAIVGAMLVLRGIAAVTEISTFALNVTTILGLGLAIDYSLFMVSRFREEIKRTDDVAAAVRTTVATAGRTVAFSGLTVAIAFIGLLFFPQMFMRSMGLGGIAVVLVDVTLSLTLLPALLAWLGPRVDAGRLPSSLTQRLRGLARPRPAGTTGGAGGWARIARTVLRRPVTVVIATTAGLGLVALPALDLVAGETDVRDLPESSTTRQDADLFTEQFPGAAATTVDVVLTGSISDGALRDTVAAMAALPNAGAATVVGQAGDGATTVTHVEITTPGDTDDEATRDLVRDLRAMSDDDRLPGVGPEVEVLVGGPASAGLDAVAAITRVLPWTLLFVAGVTMVLLFAALGSVVLPIKAVVMNVLSLGATVGLVTWGFVQGHLSGALDFTTTGRVEAANIVLIGLIALGLAMDYELFLLSRVREERSRGADDTTAIALGLQRSGRTITSAALLLVVVLAAMATSSVTFLKVIGVGLALAVAIDATVVRALLVPAAMKLLGRASWWLPAPLARLQARLGLDESSGDGGDPQGEPAPGTTEPEPALVGTR